MFIPLRTNRPPSRQPVVTETLIVLNMLVYLAGLVWSVALGTDGGEAMTHFGQLGRADFHVWQLVTYQFLHDPGSIWHLAFNMLFLWVFGAAVEDRLGRVGFAGFYLIGGAVAGIAHMMLSPAPVIGASGSIAAVTGAFLALFPRSHVQIIVFFFFIGTYSIPSLWFIGFYFLIDVLRQAGELLGGGGARVAYMAHIAGYVYGFFLAFTLLGLRVVKREEFDVFFLFKQARRRAAFRAANRGKAAGGWESASADTGQRLAAAADWTPLTAEQRTYAASRSDIARLVADHDLAAAARRYRTLLEQSPEAVLPEGHQLDIANQLQAEGDHPTAARAYELLVKSYPTCSKSAEVRLILAALYARRLGRPERALELLAQTRSRLTDAAQRALADQLLAEIGT